MTYLSPAHESGWRCEEFRLPSGRALSALRALAGNPRRSVELIGAKADRGKKKKKKETEERSQTGNFTLQEALPSKCIGIWEIFLLNIFKYQNNLETF